MWDAFVPLTLRSFFEKYGSVVPLTFEGFSGKLFVTTSPVKRTKGQQTNWHSGGHTQKVCVHFSLERHTNCISTFLHVHAFAHALTRRVLWTSSLLKMQK